MNPAATPLVILISGRGSNLKAVIDVRDTGRLPVGIRAVISNNPAAPGLEIARAAGIPTQIVDHRDFRERTDFDRALTGMIDSHKPRLVVLAGFMRILGREFIDHFAGRLINIHPSLLPAYKGINTHARALAAGERRHGATVHFVSNDVDAGPIIVQASVPVRFDDNIDTLKARVLAEEHRILPLAIGWYIQGRLSIKGGRVLLDGGVQPEQGIEAMRATGDHGS